MTDTQAGPAVNDVIPTAPQAARLVLPGPWTLRHDASDAGTPRTMPENLVPEAGVPGHVPGAVHDDLMRAGLIPDPLIGDGEFSTAWVSRANWVYTTELPDIAPTDDEQIELLFRGIDTAARISVGGIDLGRTRNMHRSYRYDVTELMRDGRTALAVYLTSAYTEAEALRDFAGPRPNAYPEPFNFIRKMACSFGWDWGITVPGAGLWQPVELQRWSIARIDSVRPLTDVDGTDGVLDLAVSVARAPGDAAELVVEVLLDGRAATTVSLPPTIDDGAATVRIPQVRRWAPRGHGEQHLYQLTVALRTRAGELLDTWQHRVGFRNIRLHRGADAAGSEFSVRVDGKPLFVRGVNWIPIDVMPGRVTPADYRRLLQRAADAHVNLVRVWGGGLYETDVFYDLCDELGLLVWQDFPFACAAYPEHEILRAEIRAEAEENVTRLARHPSLLLWNGNNECDWLRHAENWASQPGGHADWGESYYHADLPEIVNRVDPSRPYTPSSPWSGTAAIFPNAPSHGTHHSWDVWNQLDWTRYRDTVPRFVAEFGWQAPATWRTLRDAITDAELTPTAPGLVHRQRAAGGMDKLARGLASHTPVPAEFDAWHYLMQWNQVQAITAGIDHWRGHWPVCTGTIVWQLNDLWPVISWAAIDGAQRTKPLYYALRDVYAPRRLTFLPGQAGQLPGGTDPLGGGDGHLTLAAINDTDERWTGTAVVRRVADAGFDNARRPIPLDVPPRSVALLPIASDLEVFTEPASEVLVADCDGLRATWHGTEPHSSDFVGAPPRIDVTTTNEGLQLVVTATTVLRDFLVQADRLHPGAQADRGFLTLLPGESATVQIRCEEPLDADTLSEPWVMSYLDEVLRQVRDAASDSQAVRRERQR